jgi:RimJ/RimL family protein N-acetyltransferase
MASEPFWVKPRLVSLRDGAVVTLRPEETRDLEPTWDMFSSLTRDTLRFLPIPITRERVECWFRDINYERALPILAFADAPKGERMIASATLAFNQAPHVRHVAQFGITVHDDYQNRGLGTILTQYMVEIAKERGVKKVSLEVVVENERAIKVYERCGFRKEGRLEKANWNYVTQTYCDDYLMALLLES